ncbi:MAG: glycosyl hydrolase family 2 [Bacteroidales bacterium]
MNIRHQFFLLCLFFSLATINGQNHELFKVSTGMDHIQLTSFENTPSTLYVKIFKDDGSGMELYAGPVHSAEMEDGKRYVLKNLTPELWFTENPVLYRLQIYSDKRFNKYIQDNRIGFRSIESRDGRIWLNDKPVFLRGIAINPPGRGIPTEVERSRTFAYDYVSFLKRMHVNIIRIPDDHTWYDVCDELGMMVFGGNYSSRVNGLHPPEPPAYETSVKWYKETKLGPISYHPSLVIYALTNEVSYVGTAAEKWLSFLNFAYPGIKSWDPNKVIIGNAGYGYGKSGDIEDLHRYWGWYYSSPYTYLHLRDYDSITFPDKVQPITFTECVGNYTGPDGRYNLTPAHKNPVSQMCWTGHASQDLQAGLADRHQAKTLRNATELFRRLRPINPELSGVFPFTILFYNWHTVENFQDMDPKPAFAQVERSYQPVLLSWESWKYNNYAGNDVEMWAHIVNDSEDFSTLSAGLMEVELRDETGRTWLTRSVRIPEVPYYETRKVPVRFSLPENLPSGKYVVLGTLKNNGRKISVNQEEIFIADEIFAQGKQVTIKNVQLFDPNGSTAASFDLLKTGYSLTRLTEVPDIKWTLIIGENTAGELDESKIMVIRKFIENGGRLLCLRQNPDHEELLNRFLPVKLRFPKMDVDDPSYPPPLRPSGNGYHLNMEKPDHPVFKNIERFMLERWSDYTGWNESMPGMPEIYPVKSGFVLKNKQDMGSTSILANYSVGLEGIALAEFDTGSERVIVSGLDLCLRTSVDPVAARTLVNLIEYAGGDILYPLHTHINYLVKWGDYDSEKGMLTGIYSGLMLNTSPVLTGSYREKEIIVNELGHQFAEKPGGWNNRAGIQYVPYGRRVFGPYHHDGFGGVARPSNNDDSPGEGSFWCTVTPGTNLIANKVWNPADTALEIKVYCNELLLGTKILEPGEVRVIEDQFDAEDSRLKISYVASRKLVLLETSFHTR